MTARRLDKNRLQFHGATVAVIFALTLVNGLSLMRPLPSFKSNSTTSSGIFDAIRGPASEVAVSTSTAGEDTANISGNTDTLMTEASIPCAKSESIRIAPSVRQIRLIFESCTNAVISVTNETNGFQATLFEQKATDYITLAPETNVLKISRTGVVETLSIERH